MAGLVVLAPKPPGSHRGREAEQLAGRRARGDDVPSPAANRTVADSFRFRGPQAPRNGNGPGKCVHHARPSSRVLDHAWKGGAHLPPEVVGGRPAAVSYARRGTNHWFRSSGSFRAAERI